MKRTVSVCIILLALLAGLLCGCSGEAHTPGDNGLSILCATAPEYDWTRNILGTNPGHLDLQLLVGSGADLHSYQPTAQDIAAISECDLLIYTGGVSGQWISNALERAKKSPDSVINLLTSLHDRLEVEEHVDGMEAEAEDEHQVEQLDVDEHVWLSLRNAQIVCADITQALCTLDPDHAEQYQQNADAYIAQLDALDRDYCQAIEAAPLDTILVADRFPFRYLVDDYGLNYYAAFAGCSAETDASFETVIFLANQLDRLGLPAVLVIDGSNAGIADAVIENSAVGGQATLLLDSMQSTTSEQLASGTSYLSVMEANLDTLSQALQPLG